MIITEKWAFCANPKAASTSIQKALRYEKHHYENHTRLKRLKKMVKPGVFVFAFIRNPYSYLLSHAPHIPTDEFKGYVMGCKDNKAQHHYCCIDGKLAVDYLGHLETIKDDFEKICQILRISHKGVGQANKSTHKPWREYYDTESMEYVQDTFSLDFAVGGYSPDGTLISS